MLGAYLIQQFDAGTLRQVKLRVERSRNIRWDSLAMR